MSAQIPVLLEELTAHFLREDPNAALSDAFLMSLYTVNALVASIIAGFIGSRIVAEIGADLRLKVFKATQDMDMQDINKFSIPTLTKVITSDVETVSGFYAALFTSGLMLPLTLLILSPIMATKSIEMIAMIGIIMVVCFSLVFFTFRHIEPVLEEGNRNNVEVNSKVVEYMEGASVIRAYGADEKHYNEFKGISDNLLRVGKKLGRNMSYMNPMVDIMIIVIPLLIYGIAFFIMPSLDSEQQIDTLSGIISFTMYALMILTAVTQSTYVMASSYPAFVNSRTSVENVLDYKPSMKDGDKGNQDRSGSLELRDVSFAYPGQKDLFLKNINISVKPGEKIAIMGPSASGKTTIVNLMLRFYDVTSGAVLVDGMDVRDYDFKDLRSRISFYPQEPVIFSTTAFDNVRFGNLAKNVPEEEIWEIMEECESTDFLDDLPNGKDTVFSENGSELSGGQRQRIALARTMSTPGEIYILDTPFSAIDLKKEACIMDALWKRKEDSTMILVTHRVTAARRCDRIYVVEKGEIIGSGTHEELLKSCEYYSELFTLQSDWEAMS